MYSVLYYQSISSKLYSYLLERMLVTKRRILNVGWNDIKFKKDVVCLQMILIRLSEKFLSFYGEIIDALLLFYIILSNYVRFILFC